MIKLPIIGVMGSGAEKHEPLAAPLGELLARRNVHLLTGGGGGVMEAVSKSFGGCTERKGFVLGIIPCNDMNNPTIPREGYPNPWVEIPICTHLPLTGGRGIDTLSRNHINILSSDAIIVLPGGEGTRSEIQLAKQYGKPLIGFGNSETEQVALSLEEVDVFLDRVLN